MRLLFFALSAIAISAAVQLGLDRMPDAAYQATHGIGTVLFFASPVIVTAGLAYVMRIPNLLLVFFVAILSPFLSWILMVLFSVWVLHERMDFL